MSFGLELAAQGLASAGKIFQTAKGCIQILGGFCLGARKGGFA